MPLERSKSVVAYARVSTDEQSIEGVSLQSQEARMRAFCIASGRAEPIMTVDAGQSAKTLNRPGLQRILHDIKAGTVGTLVVLKLDRLTRSVGDLSTLLAIFDKYGCALVAVEESLDTATASGRLMLHLLASVSQWEREVISERTASAFEFKRRNRLVYCKGAPFGFRRDGDSLVQVPKEIAAIRTMRHLRRQGASYQCIANYLTDMGVRPSGGGKWYPQSVKVVLESKMTSTIEESAA